MKKFFVPVLLLVLVGAGLAYYMYNKPVESLDKKKAEVEISAEQLLADYEANEQAANEKYLGKVVAVTGKVVEVTTEEGKSKIHLETSNPISVVITELEEGNDTEGLQAGDQAKVKGMCSGYLSDVVLVRSTVVK